MGKACYEEDTGMLMRQEQLKLSCFWEHPFLDFNSEARTIEATCKADRGAQGAVHDIGRNPSWFYAADQLTGTGFVRVIHFYVRHVRENQHGSWGIVQDPECYPGPTIFWLA